MRRMLVDRFFRWLGYEKIVTPLAEAEPLRVSDESDRRIRILLYLRGLDYSPTVREIGKAVGLSSPSTVHAHLATLERKGLIERHGESGRISVKAAA
jgi:DNA-binding transcriptional ArsR family regulator